MGVILNAPGPALRYLRFRTEGEVADTQELRRYGGAEHRTVRKSSQCSVARAARERRGVLIIRAWRIKPGRGGL